MSLRWADIDDTCHTCGHLLDEHDDEGCAVGIAGRDKRPRCECEWVS